MSRTIITIRPMREARADWKVSCKISSGRVIQDEIRGGEGSAAAFALERAINFAPAIIIADNKIMALLPKEFGGEK